MSLDATNWAWRAEVEGASQRLLLLTLADRAGEDHKCYPSLKRIIKDTMMNRKTIIKCLDELEANGLIRFTGELKGNGVKVYQLVGVFGREDSGSTHPKNGTSTKKGTGNQLSTGSNFGTGSNIGTSTENGTETSTKIGTETSTNIGTQNLPMNLPLESKNKKGWFCLKTLREEMAQADPEIDPNEVIHANWFEREKKAFEIYNAENNLCDALMNFHFADWLLHAYRSKYSKPAVGHPAKSQTASGPKHLTEKQIAVFAQKLSHHAEFAGKFSEPGDSYEKLAAKIAVKLENPIQAKKWEPYLKQVGFSGELPKVVEL